MNREDFMKKIFYTAMFFMTTLYVTYISGQPEHILIQNSKIYSNRQRTPVKFPHGIHMTTAASCLDCHHFYVNGKNILDEDELTEGNPKIKCASCHWEKKSGNRFSLMDAFHRQCIGCHRKLSKSKKKSGPVMCASCHPWKK